MKNGRTKLSDAQVHAIREAFRKGSVTKTELAAAYGVTPCHIADIIRGTRRWNAK